MKNITIIGTGIVGLATGIKLLEKYPDVKIQFIEKENDVAKHQTGNNSGVIHSGIYYKPGSLKATNCRRGYKYLIDFCEKYGIEYNLIGKIIVATREDELPYLEQLYERGLENGLKQISKISAEEIKEVEPSVNGIAGIKVPETGIVDYKEVSQKMKELLENAGAEFHFNEEVISISGKENEIVITTKNNNYVSDFAVSCAGLQSDRIAKMTDKNINFRIIPFRGEYYKLSEAKNTVVKSLIYPVPDPAFPFLGVHFTPMIKGGIEAGPNAVFAFKREGYTRASFNLSDTLESFSWSGFRKVAAKYWRTGVGEFYRSFNKKAFTKALQRLVPEIAENNLVPGGAGIRAQACDKTGGLLDDFYFIEHKRILQVCNAPSPAATSSLSIGEYITEKLEKHF